MSWWARFLPFLLLLIVIAGLVWRLSVPSERDVRSTLVGKPIPDAEIGPIDFNGKAVRLRSLSGKPMMVNFFASWCVPCVAEAPQLRVLQRRGTRIVGIAVRDQPDAVRAFLRDHGNPYELIGTDPQSTVQISLGSSGVPESFIVDGRGIIRYQHIGAIEPTDVAPILAKIDEAK